MRGLIPLFATLTVASCTIRTPLNAPAPIKLPTPVDLQVSVRTYVKADVLFMVDNSPSMGPMQTELHARFGDLLSSLGINAGAGPIDLHLGVVTSDYGAGPVARPLGGCDASPGGQRGLLQAVGAAADASCQAPLGAPFLQYAVAADGTVTSNLPSGQDLTATFTCMASVGSAGCGFEHQLESVYAALHDPTTNPGFLRPDAQLVVVLLTNEDDGSAPPSSDAYSPDSSAVSQYGPYDTYRQTHLGVACGNPLALTPDDDSMGPLAGCQQAGALGQLYDVQRYIDLFTKPASQGGVKADPSQVALIALAAPATPVSIILADAATGIGRAPSPAYVTCSPMNPPSCVPRVQHSCQNLIDPAFFGDPAVRIERVVQSVPAHYVTSICGIDAMVVPDYAPFMGVVAQSMRSQVGATCLTAPLVQPTSPTCSVTLAHADGTTMALPACLGSNAPCWTVTPAADCPAVTNPETNALERARLSVAGALPSDTVEASCRSYPTM